MQESVACLFLNNNENDALLTWSSWVRIFLVAVTPQIDSLRKGPLYRVIRGTASLMYDSSARI